MGTPERPLSDLGLVSYRGYWTRQLLPILMAREGSVSIKELSEATRIRTDDIMTTLTHLASSLVWIIIASLLIMTIFRIFTRYLAVGQNIVEGMSPQAIE